MKTRARFLVGLLWIVVASSAFAVKVDLLYQAQVAVTTQAPLERNAALPVALAQVLVKVSGNTRVADNPSVKSQLNTAGKIVQEFSYTALDSSQASFPSYLLSVNFDPDAVNTILRNANVPIWGQGRPLVLVWVDVEKANRLPEIISNDSPTDVLTAFQHEARLRGLPIVFPVMDITDLNQVSVKDVAAMTIPTVINASKRYGSEAILIGRIAQGQAGFTSQWKLILKNNEWNWNMTGGTVETIVQPLIDNIMNTLASQYAVVTSNAVQTELNLHVVGVTQNEDFSKLIRYLSHLAPVANVDVARISGNEIVLRLSLRGSPEAFAHAVAGANKLIPLNLTEWKYQWNP